MKYIVYGFLLGLLLGIVPLFVSTTGFVLIPMWYGSLQNIQAIEPSSNNETSTTFAITTDNGYYYVLANGKVQTFINANDAFVKPTVDGKFYITYKKVGNEIAMYNAFSEFFWKLPSTEYPYISPDGSIIILLTADGSSARIADFNGNIYPNSELNGQFTTTLSFSQKGSFAGIGFIDGRYYLLNNKGQILYKAIAPLATIVKGIAIDDSGSYAMIHCGNSKKDYIVGINIAKQKTFTYELSAPHYIKTSMAINTVGKALFLDIDKLLEIDIKGKEVTSYQIIKKRYGQSQISSAGDIFMISYPTHSGGSIWYVWQWGKGILYQREFYEEPFLHHILVQNIILLQGQDMLMCFSYHH